MTAPQDRSIVLHDIELQPEELDALVEELRALCHQYDLVLEDHQLELCIKHLLYVEQVNQYINLTRIVDTQSALVLHILDSLLLAPYVMNPEGELLDMGTGAGFPGIPLHIALGMPCTLLDSVGKKVRAVSAFCDALQLHAVNAVHDRIEVFGSNHRAEFNTVIARALAPLPILIEYAAPLLALDGQLLVSKGSPTDDELCSGSSAAQLCGMELADTRSFDLPYDMGHRTVFTFIKTGEARVKLPRPVGAAKRNPLA